MRYRMILFAIVSAVLLLTSPALIAAETEDRLQRGLEAYEAGDYAAALDAWRPAADGGNTNAMYAIGNLYANGFGVGEDLSLAKDWYCRAARLGHQQASDILGEGDVEEICSHQE